MSIEGIEIIIKRSLNNGRLRVSELGRRMKPTCLSNLRKKVHLRNGRDGMGAMWNEEGVGKTERKNSGRYFWLCVKSQEKSQNL